MDIESSVMRVIDTGLEGRFTLAGSVSFKIWSDVKVKAD